MLLALLVGAAAVSVGRGALSSIVPDPPASAAEPTAGVPAADGTAVTVRPGDTYWSIARRAQPSGDIRPLVDRLVAAHGDGVLRPGERVVVG